jgi:hypothetical protein
MMVRFDNRPGETPRCQVNEVVEGEGPMVSRLSPTQPEFSDDLVVAESPSLRRRSTESEFSERPPFIDKPSHPRRPLRAFARYLFAVCIGVAATLAWQSYGEVPKQMAASWAGQNGWLLPWLSYREADQRIPPTPSAEQAIARTVSSLERQLSAIAVSLAAMQQRIEQLDAGQAQTASDIAKLQAADEEIRHQIIAPPQRPAAAPASKPMPTAPPARSSTPPR